MVEGGLIILSGGKNSRMGQNKAFLQINNRTIIETILAKLEPLFREVVLVTNSPEMYSGLNGVRIVQDILPQKGPLSGIHSGLVNASFERNLVVACDMPFIDGNLALNLFQVGLDFDVTVPVVEGKYQPLFAVYSKHCVKPIEEQLFSGQYKITSFYKRVKIKEIEVNDFTKGIGSEKIFYNVNTPKELEEARKMATEEASEVKKQVKVWRWKEGSQSILDDTLVTESPLTIYLNKKEIVTLLCTPDNMEELAIGFLLSEGLIKQGDNGVKVKVDKEESLAWVSSEKTSIIAEQTFLKRYVTTGCGKGTTFYNVMDAQCTPVESDFVIRPEKVIELMQQALQSSQLFKETGGVHLTALGSAEQIILYREDIGRHNALDKIIGHCYMEGIDIKDKVLLTTGRLSSEILLKTAKLGVPVLVSRSAPTALSVQLAQQLGVTLVGFARAGRFNLYAHEYRVAGGVGL